MGRDRSAPALFAGRLRLAAVDGLTLVEVLVASMILVVVIVLSLEVFFRQSLLSEHATNLAWAMNDANRIMEQLRQQNSGGLCVIPSVTPPGGFASWDLWLADALNGGGGKSVQSALADELAVVSSAGVDPVQVTVAICWRSRDRVLGECTWNGAQLVPNDLDGNGIITAPAALSTLFSCRP